MINGTANLHYNDDTKILPLGDSHPFNPLDAAAGIRVPERLDVGSAWTGHIPFAMHLVKMTRPRLLVELGSHWGMSYCAFCQTVKDFGLPTRCHAVDTWQGDGHATSYASEVFTDLKAHHDPRYSLFSTLIRSTFDEALPQFDNKSIDILHIDGFHSYEAVRHDFETWLPKMSTRGIVLFHDTNVRDREGFGVWRYWDEIKSGYPHFEFLHSFGLGILVVGDEIPKWISGIVNSSPREGKMIQDYYANQGNYFSEIQNISLVRKDLLKTQIQLAGEVNNLACLVQKLNHQNNHIPTLIRSLFGAIRNKVYRIFNRK